MRLHESMYESKCEQIKNDFVNHDSFPRGWFRRIDIRFAAISAMAQRTTEADLAWTIAQHVGER